VPATDYSTILIPGLGSDLHRVEVAHVLGLTQRTHPLLTALALLGLLLLIVLLAGWWLLRIWRRGHPA
jgi:hypothetical protein